MYRIIIWIPTQLKQKLRKMPTQDDFGGKIFDFPTEIKQIDMTHLNIRSDWVTRPFHVIRSVLFGVIPTSNSPESTESPCPDCV